jgi:hypothetical protein
VYIFVTYIIVLYCFVDEIYNIINHAARFEVFMAVELMVFWVVKCYVVVGYQRFRSSCCLHLQGGSMVLQNAGIQPPHYTLQQPRKPSILSLANILRQA